MNSKFNVWLKSAISATIGGGISAAAVALGKPEGMDLASPQGRTTLLWSCITGAIIAAAGYLAKSPLPDHDDPVKVALVDNLNTAKETLDKLDPSGKTTETFVQEISADQKEAGVKKDVQKTMEVVEKAP